MTEKENKNDLLIQQLVSVERVSLNLSQSVIVTTEDKLRLKLQGHISMMNKTREWIAPFSLLVSIVLALVSADFKDFIFSSATWKALFTISGVLAFLWLTVSLRKAFNSHSIDSLVEEIKSDIGSNNTLKEDDAQ